MSQSKKWMVVVCMILLLLIVGCSVGQTRETKTEEDKLAKAWNVDLLDFTFSSKGHLGTIRTGDELSVQGTEANHVDVLVLDAERRIVIKPTSDFSETSEDLLITLPKELTALQISHGAFLLDLSTKEKEFSAMVHGVLSGELVIDDAEQVDLMLGGANDLNIRGESRRASMKVEGATKVDAFEFKVSNLSVNLKGAATAQVYASEELSANVDGVGSVIYDGEPENLNKEISGVGIIRPRQ